MKAFLLILIFSLLSLSTLSLYQKEKSLLQVSHQTELSQKKMRSFCEICILVIQMKQRGFPHLCAGLSSEHWETCVMVLESLLREDKGLTYWLKKGCIFLDSTGASVVQPCPALNICSWTPNLFAQPPSLIRDSVESLCPKDPHFLPTIPNEFSSVLNRN